MFSISSHFLPNFLMLTSLYILPNSYFRETNFFLDLMRNIGKWSVISLNKMPELIGISNDLVGIFTKKWSSFLLVWWCMEEILGTGVSSNILLLYFHWYLEDWCYNHRLKYKSLLYLTCSERFQCLWKMRHISIRMSVYTTNNISLPRRPKLYKHTFKVALGTFTCLSNLQVFSFGSLKPIFLNINCNASIMIVVSNLIEKCIVI